MYNTIIKFDENEFSFADSDEIVSAQGWTNFDRVENSITFYRQDLLPNKDDQEIGKIKLIANKDINIGEKSIIFSSNELVVENAEGKEKSLNTEDIKVNIKIINENDIGNDTENEEENQNTASIPGSSVDYKSEEESTAEKNYLKQELYNFQEYYVFF